MFDDSLSLCDTVNWYRVFKFSQRLAQVAGYFKHLRQLLFVFQILFNACVAHGGWVPRNLGAGAADPNPGSKSTPKDCPTRNQLRAPPAIPSPSPSTRHTEPGAPWK